MLNALSTPLQADKDTKREWYFASNAYYKYVGGAKKFKKLAERLLDKARETKKDQYTEPFVWDSKTGNHWYLFIVIRYYPKADDIYPHLMGFCYYETAASIGVFMPVANVSPSGEEGESFVMHFTDHFFLRFASRTGIKANTKENIEGFVKFIYKMELMINPDKSMHGNDADIIVKLPGSYGFGGINHEGKATMFTVNTFLKKSELSGYKKKLVQKLDKFASKNEYLPQYLQEKYMVKSSENPEEMTREYERIKESQILAGMPKEILEKVEYLSSILVCAAIDLGYFKSYDIKRILKWGMTSRDTVFQVISSPFWMELTVGDITMIFRKVSIEGGYEKIFDLKASYKYFTVKTNMYTEDEFEENWGNMSFDVYTPKQLLTEQK